MKEKLYNLKTQAISLILSAQDSKELEDIRLQFLGRNGSLTNAMKEISHISAEEKPIIGRLLNETKKIIEDAISQKLSSLNSKPELNHPVIDVTDPGLNPPIGHLHLVTQAIAEISSIFNHIGFSRVRYPEIEWDYYAFTTLNFPEDHPARDDWETFFIDQKPDSKYGPQILTPHTSSGQVREMEKAASENKKTGNPIDVKMLNIAKCYRRQSDISHTQMFHQFEGLVIGEKISIIHLKGVLDYFVKSYFGEKRNSRIRPYHFQFTEPSFEVDVSCGICLGKSILSNGQACRICKGGWLELGGAGMVHPNVLEYGGIDSKKYTGFAFGWGIERVLMMKQGLILDDIRLLYSNKLDFLEQF
jgi:phenylalanyl-tRNA synthetase alpha chain